MEVSNNLSNIVQKLQARVDVQERQVKEFKASLDSEIVQVKSSAHTEMLKEIEKLTESIQREKDKLDTLN